jgi:hypothetical protein
MNKTNKRQHARAIDYKKVFSSPEGRRVLYDLMDQHRVLSSTFLNDVNQMLIYEGERNAVLRILTILKIDPNEFLKRIEEHERDERNSNGDE